MSSAYVGERFGAFVAQTRLEDVPAAVRHEAKRSLLNYFGCALGVARDPAIEALVRVLGPLAGPPQATLVGRGERLDMMGASFVNAAGANFLDYDDTHLNTVIHPTAPVAAPAFALAEARGGSGAEVLLAFILGAEVECRVGNMVSPGHYARGWHITSTCGAFGAAAACARLLGLDAVRTWHALGIAASQSAGLVENLSTPAKNIGVGHAARGGLFAALMAAEGYTAAPAALEGPLGWARAMGDLPDTEEATGGLGERWEMARNTYKPYPAGIVFHSVIDACLHLRKTHGLSADGIAGVTVTGNALLLARGDRAVNNERDARVSIHHSAAVALLRGAAGLHEFSTAMASDSAVAAFRRKVRAALDDTLPSGAATVRVETQGGEILTATVRQPWGSEADPMTDTQLEAKASDLVRHGGVCVDINAIVSAVWGLEEAKDVTPLMQATMGRKP